MRRATATVIKDKYERSLVRDPGHRYGHMRSSIARWSLQLVWPADSPPAWLVAVSHCGRERYLRPCARCGHFPNRRWGKRDLNDPRPRYRPMWRTSAGGRPHADFLVGVANQSYLWAR